MSQYQDNVIDVEGWGSDDDDVNDAAGEAWDAIWEGISGLSPKAGSAEKDVKTLDGKIDKGSDAEKEGAKLAWQAFADMAYNVVRNAEPGADVGDYAPTFIEEAADAAVKLGR